MLCDALFQIETLFGILCVRINLSKTEAKTSRIAMAARTSKKGMPCPDDAKKFACELIRKLLADSRFSRPLPWHQQLLVSWLTAHPFLLRTRSEMRASSTMRAMTTFPLMAQMLLLCDPYTTHVSPRSISL
jgi:hypothetical protein